MNHPLVETKWWAWHNERELSVPAADAAANRVAFAAIVVFTFILLLSPQSWFPILGKLRIALLAGGVTALVLLWDRWTRRERLLNITPEIAVAMGLLAWAILTLPLSYWPGGSMDLLTDLYLKALIAFWLLANVVTTEGRVRSMAVVLSLCTVPLAVTGFRHFAGGTFLDVHGPGAERIAGYQSGLTSNPNDMALMLNLILPLIIANFLGSSRQAMRFLWAVVIVIAITGVVVTFSRGGFLGLAAVGLVYFFKLIRRPGNRGWALAILFVGILALPMLPDSYVNRMSTITSVEADPTGSAQERWRDQIAAMKFVIDHPIVGAGLGMDVLALNDVRGPRWHSVHNVYFQYAVDLGLPGLVLFLLLQSRVFRAATTARKAAAPVPSLRKLACIAEGLQVSLIVFAVAGLFHPVAYNFYFYFMAALALGARAAAEHAIAGEPDRENVALDLRPAPAS